jgi:nucleoside-diphosphate-sugar epimerase
MNALTGRRVVLVGGAGFIGHNLALALSRGGASITIVDNLQINNLLSYASADSRPDHRALSMHILRQRFDLIDEAGIALRVLDARDDRALADLLQELRPQVVIHLAGLAHAQSANVHPQKAFEHTLRSLQGTLEASRPVAEHFIYFSSSMVYGHFASAAVTEEDACNPLGIYGALKYAGEKLVISYGQVFDLPYTIVRPSALYGERCVSRRVSQIFVENAMQGLDLIVAGDGEERLDFTYIEDLVAGIAAIMTSDESRGEIFNLTYGHGRSINEMVALVARQFPGTIVRHEARDRLMPLRGTLCIDKARMLLGYQPSWPLERGLPKYVQWYRSLGALPGHDQSAAMRLQAPAGRTRRAVSA